MKLADLTWVRLRDVPRETVVVLPLASLEQHSMHLPFGCDIYILEALLDRLEQTVGKHILTLPVQWLACSDRHAKFRGTVSLAVRNYMDDVVEATSSMARAGFARALLLNAQWENEPRLALCLERLRERHPGMAAVAASYWQLVPSDGTVGDAGPGHGGDLETSLLLYLRPELVDTDRIVRDETASSSSFARSVLQHSRMDQSSHHGGCGNPEKASAEKGRRVFEAAAAALGALVQDLRDGMLAV
jgi:creatinine amidohydrolase